MYIFILVIGASAVDYLLNGHERAQDTLYKITFFGVWFLFVIRYYYGPDIYNYVPFYEGLRPWTWYLRHPEHYEYEHGFVLFCAMLKGLGLSYYHMTAIVTTFYFAMVAVLFRRIKRHKTLALMILVLFDYGMIVAMHRQCMSISFFLLMVVLMDKKKWLWSLLCAVLVVEMHKSGIFIVSLTWLFYLLHQHQQERTFFVVALALLCVMLVIPLSSISTSFIHSLPFPPSFAKSLEMHFGLGRQIQVIWVIYAACILFIEYALRHRTEPRRATEAAVMAGVVFLVVFYHYFYLLERLRSFFLPILLTYLFRVVQDAEDSDEQLMNRQVVFFKNGFIAFLFLYFGLRAVNFDLGVQRYRSKLHTPGGKTIYSPCTVFDLRHHSAKYLRQERMQIAEYYWWYDFMQGEKYKLKDKQ